MLCHKRCHILIHRLPQTGLDEEGMIYPAVGLYHTQIVNPSVTVEIEVVDHIPAGVDDLLELRYVTRLCESCSYGVKVEIEREVSIEIGYRHGRDRRVLRGWRSHCGRINRLRRRYRFYCRSHREDTCPATCQTQRCES